MCICVSQDMNEPANFGTNLEKPWNWPDDVEPWSLKCPINSDLEDPPYRTSTSAAFHCHIVCRILPKYYPYVPVSFITFICFCFNVLIFNSNCMLKNKKEKLIFTFTIISILSFSSTRNFTVLFHLHYWLFNNWCQIDSSNKSSESHYFDGWSGPVSSVSDS